MAREGLELIQVSVEATRNICTPPGYEAIVFRGL